MATNDYLFGMKTHLSFLYQWSLVAAMAGFLFGFDTVVISGADQALQRLWQSTDLFHGTVVVGMALWGTVVGALFGGRPTHRLGRKKTLVWIGVLYSLSALGSALANDPYSFAVFRFLGGLGVGVSTIAAPAYISEIAPAKDRGRLVGLYQFNIVLGILIAFCSNYLLRDLGAHAWRYMLGIEALPALVYTALALRIPQSPRWLYGRGQTEKARAILAQVYPNKEVAQALDDLAQEAGQQGAARESLWDKKYRFAVFLAFSIALFNQFSGINAFLYYAPRIFEAGGLGESTALLSSVGIGLVNLLFTLLGIGLIDRWGRKRLMYLGSVGYIVSLSLIAASFVFAWGGMALPLFLFLFIAAHAVGQGAVIWVFISEIFPNAIRSSGQALGTSTHWVLAALIPSFVPVLFTHIGPAAVFAFFAFMMGLQLAFVYFYMPETKGVSLEKMSEQMQKQTPA